MNKKRVIVPVLCILAAGAAVGICIWLWLAFLFSRAAGIGAAAALSAVALVLAIAATVIAARRAHRAARMLSALFTVLTVISLTVYYPVMLSSGGAGNWRAASVAEAYALTDWLNISTSAPADAGFPADDDGSVDTAAIKASFGHGYIGMVQGVDAAGRKLLVVYPQNAADALAEAAVFELDADFDTLCTAAGQGYGSMGGDIVYPIADIAESPAY